MPLSRHIAGTYPEASLHSTCRGTLGHSRLSSLVSTTTITTTTTGDDEI